jgi:predicted MPP superfamily phosphohydrolase
MRVIRVSRLGIIAVGLSVLGLAGYGLWVEPNQLVVRHVWIEDASLAEVLKGKVVVQISDLHMEEIGRREQKVLQILNKLKPDLIFLTGDYVQWDGDYEAALAFLPKLKAKVGVWAVMGDYDYSGSRKSCLFCHEKGSGRPTRRHSVQFLRNSYDKVDLTDGFIWIGGVDWEMERLYFSDGQLSAGKGKGPTIILSHNPLNFDLLDDDNDTLMLSGDTHGGQIPLPSWLWRILGYEKSARYAQGLFENGRKKMFVSRGIGTSHIPIRLFCPPEVVVLHFTPN